MIMVKPPSLVQVGARRRRATPHSRHHDVGHASVESQLGPGPEPAAAPSHLSSPDDRVVRCKEALRILGVSRATLYRLPIKRVKITPGKRGAVGWWLSDLRLHLALGTE